MNQQRGRRFRSAKEADDLMRKAVQVKITMKYKSMVENVSHK